MTAWHRRLQNDVQRVGFTHNSDPKRIWRERECLGKASVRSREGSCNHRCQKPGFKFGPYFSTCRTKLIGIGQRSAMVHGGDWFKKYKIIICNILNNVIPEGYLLWPKSPIIGARHDQRLCPCLLRMVVCNGVSAKSLCAKAYLWWSKPVLKENNTAPAQFICPSEGGR